MFQFTDIWGDGPEYFVSLIVEKLSYFKRAIFYRFAFRRIVGFTEQKVIMCILPPACVTGNSLFTEANPSGRASWKALFLIGACNTYVFDWLAHLRVDKNLNDFIFSALPFPQIHESSSFIAHSALRLSCNHAGFASLWREQLVNEWKERGKERFTWPVLSGDDERWEFRSAIDAVVADAYGLSRGQYEHVLSSFSHSSYPKAPELCLAKFVELKKIGIDAFTKKYDPYWDIPLNENLPKPVIDLPIPGGETDEDGKFKFTSEPIRKRRKRRTK